MDEDVGKVSELYEVASDAGNAHAKNNLGLCYDYGAGVDIDDRKAVELYKIGLNAGNAQPRFYLFDCKESRIGDEQKGVQYYQKATDADK